MAVLLVCGTPTVREVGVAAVVVAVLAHFSSSVSAAGYCDGRESAPYAQALRLGPGEQARHGVAPGSGLKEVHLTADVFVAGGGSAGVSAALAAARSGAKTVLVHGNPVLGGNSGSQIKLAMVGACGPRASDSNALEMECREGGIVEEYTLDNAVGNPNRVAELFSLDLYSKFRLEPNADLYLDTWLVSVVKKGTSIVQAIAENQISQTRYVVTAKVFIDTTGDGRLGAEAGAEFIMGREGKLKYNESIAEGPDNETEGSSLAWVSVDKGSPQPFTPPPWARKFNASDFKYRNVNFFQYGYWWNEVSFPYNTITDNNDIRDQLLTNMFGIWDFIKNSGLHPTSSTWALEWFGNVPCKREGRRFIGQYVASQNDIMSDPHASPPQHPLVHWDTVAYSGWPFDLHNPRGMNETSAPPYSSYATPYMFGTSLRSLVSRNVDNLLFAGRLASFSHVVFGSQRVMKTGSTMGQAAGTAAAYCASKGMTPAALTQSKDDVWSVQQQLLRDDAFVINQVNEDPRDHARSATLSASSETITDQVNGSAANVVSGQSRAVVTDLKSAHDRGGVAPGQGVPGSNRWVSSELPASLSLSWPAPIDVAQVHLVFDTGMHRKLTFSVRQNGVGIWGPQPETVRAYTIEAQTPGSDAWVLLCNVTDNYQRKRVHAVPCDPSAPPYWPPLQPGGGPSPPPASQSGAVMAECSVGSKTQHWDVNADGTISSLAYPAQCLSYINNETAVGGHGQRVALGACATAPKWLFDASLVNGSTLALPTPTPCANYQGSCQCVKAVGDTPTPNGGVELWKCPGMEGDGHWARLRLGNSDTTSLLMAQGMCLDSGKPRQQVDAPETHHHEHQQRRTVAAANSTTLVSALRINVLATHGVSEARINEVRIYGPDGIAPFPQRSAQ